LHKYLIVSNREGKLCLYSNKGKISGLEVTNKNH
jgi:hypothetical protein